MKIDGADRDWLLTPPSYEPELRRLMVDAPWITEHVTETGTHREAFLGVQATGRSVAVPGFAFYRIDADRRGVGLGLPRASR